MLVPADGISDQRGVLAEPAATALHAVMRWTRRGDTAVVIGSGTLSRLIVATLRRLHPDLDIIVLHDARNDSRPRLGRRHRETVLLERRPQRRLHGDPVDRRQPRVARLVRAADRIRRRSTWRRGVMRPAGGGLPVLDGGVDVVFDCHASGLSIDLAVRLLRAGGTLVLCGRRRRHDIEWSLIWARELTVRGAASYGREPDGRRTFGTVREWLSNSSFPIDGVVTHRFPLDEYGAALSIANAGVAAGAVKVVFEGPAATILRPAPAAAVVNLPDEPVLLQSTAARVRGSHAKVS